MKSLTEFVVLRTRIFRLLGAERIAIPFPTRTLDVRDRTQTDRQ
jgi:hypothetical protein